MKNKTSQEPSEFFQEMSTEMGTMRVGASARGLRLPASWVRKICLARAALNGTEGSQDILHPVMHPFLDSISLTVSRLRPLLMGNASSHLIPHQTAWVPISCMEGICQHMRATEWWLLQRLVDSCCC